MQISSALSISPFEIEVLFSEDVSTEDALNETYNIAPVEFAAPCDVLSVSVERVGFEDPEDVRSVILLHTGTTIGGSYRVSVPASVSPTFLSRGAVPAFRVTALSGDQLKLNFNQPITGLDAQSLSFSSDTAIVPLKAQTVSIASTTEYMAKTIGQTAKTYECTLSAPQEIGATFTDESGSYTDEANVSVSFDLDTSTIGSPDPAILAEIVLTHPTHQARLQLAWDGLSPYLIANGNIRAGWFWLGRHTFRVILNRVAGSLVFLLDGEPVDTISIGDLVVPDEAAPHVQIAHDPNALSLTIHSGQFLATSTVLSNAWNFYAGESVDFEGSDQLTTRYLRTHRGPLIKDDGDPASKEDIEVKVDGVVVDVDKLNPYTGEVYLQEALPRMPPGEISVEVDYKWIASPTFTLNRLNSHGLVLNKYDSPRGRHSTNASGRGSAPTQRFPYSVVISPRQRKAPKLISHRYLGFENAYSSTLNRPTSLRLNNHPNRSRVSPFLKRRIPQSISYQSGRPQGWALIGQGEGTDDYTLPLAAPHVYTQDVDLSFPSAADISVRLSAEAVSLEGVYTGVGFGVHDAAHLYLVGLLAINGLKHIGFLKDPFSPHLQDGWEIGPKYTIKLLSQTQFELPTAPERLGEGDRFQILSGPQEGVYSIKSFVGGVVEIDGQFPEDITLWGQNYPSAIFEMRWDRTTTYRLTVDFAQEVASLVVSGDRTTKPILMDGQTPPPTSSLFAAGSGQVFWGQVSEQAIARSTWDFCQFDLRPNSSIERGHTITVSPSLDVLPYQEQNPWASVSSLGQSREGLFISAQGEYGYRRFEPFLSQDPIFELDVTLRARFGPVGLQVEDGRRRVQIDNLLYVEDGTRQRVEMLSKAFRPDSWTLVTESDVSQTPLGVLTSEPQGWVVELASSPYEGGRAFGVTLAVVESTHNDSGDTGIEFTGEASGKTVTVALSDGGVRIASGVDVIHEFDFDWSGEAHSYQCVVDGVVLVYVDDELKATLDLDLFEDVDGATHMSFGAFGTNMLGQPDETISATVEWQAGFIAALPSANVKRTIGLRRVENPSSIDDWAIPRGERSEKPNSSLDALVQEWDWQEDLSFKLVLDPQWGVSLLTDDDPPYYQAEDSSTATGFHSRVTEPTAAWASIEYDRLPSGSVPIGSVYFGAFGVSHSHWDLLAYKIRRHWKEDEAQPQGMVLNRYNTISSSQLLGDKTLERVEIESIDSRRIYFKPLHMRVARVYKIVDGGRILTSEDWEYDVEAQLLTLSGAEFSEVHAKVDVIYVPGEPVTSTYLKKEPFWEAGTYLNEDTPPFPKSQIFDPKKTDEGRHLDHVDESRYSHMSFYEKTNGGQEGLIQFPAEATELDGLSGVEEAEDGSLKAYGGQVLGISGLFDRVAPRQEFEGSTLFASGGSFYYSDVGGRVPIGGRLGSVVLGRPSRRTDIITQLRYEEELGVFHDWSAPTLESDEAVNPSAFPRGVGAVFVSIQYAGDYSRYGPWGGLDSLTPKPDSIYLELDGLADGDSVSFFDGGLIASFVARDVPLFEGEFSTVQPHVSLAQVISSHSVSSWFRAVDSGLTWGGVPSVLLEADQVMTQDHLLILQAEGIQLVGGRELAEGQFTLSGGVKIRQSSLLHGGPPRFSRYDTAYGMVAYGGAALPAGRVESSQVSNSVAGDFEF